MICADGDNVTLGHNMVIALQKLSSQTESEALVCIG